MLYSVIRGVKMISIQQVNLIVANRLKAKSIECSNETLARITRSLSQIAILKTLREEDYSDYQTAVRIIHRIIGVAGATPYSVDRYESLANQVQAQVTKVPNIVNSVQKLFLGLFAPEAYPVLAKQIGQLRNLINGNLPDEAHFFRTSVLKKNVLPQALNTPLREPYQGNEWWVAELRKLFQTKPPLINAAPSLFRDYPKEQANKYLVNLASGNTPSHTRLAHSMLKSTLFVRIFDRSHPSNQLTAKNLVALAKHQPSIIQTLLAEPRFGARNYKKALNSFYVRKLFITVPASRLSILRDNELRVKLNSVLDPRMDNNEFKDIVKSMIIDVRIKDNKDTLTELLKTRRGRHQISRVLPQLTGLQLVSALSHLPKLQDIVLNDDALKRRFLEYIQTDSLKMMMENAKFNVFIPLALDNEFNFRDKFLNALPSSDSLVDLYLQYEPIRTTILNSPDLIANMLKSSDAALERLYKAFPASADHAQKIVQVIEHFSKSFKSILYSMPDAQLVALYKTDPNNQRRRQIILSDPVLADKILRMMESAELYEMFLSKDQLHITEKFFEDESKAETIKRLFQYVQANTVEDDNKIANLYLAQSKCRPKIIQSKTLLSLMLQTPCNNLSDLISDPLVFDYLYSRGHRVSGLIEDLDRSQLTKLYLRSSPRISRLLPEDFDNEHLRELAIQSTSSELYEYWDAGVDSIINIILTEENLLVKLLSIMPDVQVAALYREQCKNPIMQSAVQRFGIATKILTLLRGQELLDLLVQNEWARKAFPQSMTVTLYQNDKDFIMQYPVLMAKVIRTFAQEERLAFFNNHKDWVIANDEVVEVLLELDDGRIGLNMLLDKVSQRQHSAILRLEGLLKKILALADFEQFRQLFALKEIESLIIKERMMVAQLTSLSPKDLLAVYQGEGRFSELAKQTIEKNISLKERIVAVLPQQELIHLYKTFNSAIINNDQVRIRFLDGLRLEQLLELCQIDGNLFRCLSSEEKLNFIKYFLNTPGIPTINAELLKALDAEDILSIFLSAEVNTFSLQQVIVNDSLLVSRLLDRRSNDQLQAIYIACENKFPEVQHSMLQEAAQTNSRLRQEMQVLAKTDNEIMARVFLADEQFRNNFIRNHIPGDALDHMLNAVGPGMLFNLFECNQYIRDLILQDSVYGLKARMLSGINRPQLQKLFLEYPSLRMLILEDSSRVNNLFTLVMTEPVCANQQNAGSQLAEIFIKYPTVRNSILSKSDNLWALVNNASITQITVMSLVSIDFREWVNRSQDQTRVAEIFQQIVNGVNSEAIDFRRLFTGEELLNFYSEDDTARQFIENVIKGQQAKQLADFIIAYAIAADKIGQLAVVMSKGSSSVVDRVYEKNLLPAILPLASREVLKTLYAIDHRAKEIIANNPRLLTALGQNNAAIQKPVDGIDSPANRNSSVRLFRAEPSPGHDSPKDCHQQAQQGQAEDLGNSSVHKPIC